MIRNITGGVGITVTGSVYNTPYIDTTRPSSGMVRYINNNIEVYDGSAWVTLGSSYPQIDLDGVTQEAIQWVKQKMIEEKRMLELAKTHPTVADALAAQQRAEEAVRIAVALCDIK